MEHFGHICERDPAPVHLQIAVRQAAVSGGDVVTHLRAWEGKTSSIIRPTQSSSTEPPNQLSAYASPPRPDPHLSKARTLIRAFLATPPSTYLSNSILIIINSHLAAALATARDIYVAALPHLQTQARHLLDLCRKNIRYLQAAREHERRLIVQSQLEPRPLMTADGEPPSSASSSSSPRELALTIASQRMDLAKNGSGCTRTSRTSDPRPGGGQTATLNQSDDQDTKPVYILQYSPTRYLSTSNKKQTLCQHPQYPNTSSQQYSALQNAIL